MKRTKVKRIKSRPKTIKAKVSNELELLFCAAVVSIGYGLGGQTGIGIAGGILLFFFVAICASESEREKTK